MSTKVLLVDDDERLVSLMQRGMAYEGLDVIVAIDGPAALEAARCEDPDVVLLDIGMPGIDGFETCRRLRLDHSIPVIMLTALDATSDKVKALRLGADDYLTKPFALEELIARIWAILRRCGSAVKELTYADLVIELDSRQARRRSRPLALTRKEFELLSLLARHPRQVLTTDQIIEQIWGVGGPNYRNAVEAHVARLRRKMEADGEPRLIETVWGIGYSLRGSNADSEAS